MGTHRQIQPLNVIETWQLPDGRSGASLYTTASINKLDVFKDDTVRRVRPLDLFANGTARTVTSEYNSTGDLVYVRYSSGIKYTYTGDSVHRLFNLSHSAAAVPSFTSLDNRVLSKLRGDAVNLAQFIAEYRQTGKLFYDVTELLVNSVIALVKKRPGLLRPKQTWDKSLAGHHLKWVYGVEPLVSDVGGMVEMIDSRLRTDDFFIKGAVKNRTFQTDLRSVSSGNALYHAFLDDTSDLRMKVNYRARLKPQGFTGTLATYGFTNPVSLLYELTPYSFVFDWWFNLGEVLSSLDNCLLFDNVEVIRSYYRRRSTMPRWKSGLWWGGGSKISLQTVRQAPQALSTISRLHYKPSVSARHIANGVALLVSRREWR